MAAHKAKYLFLFLRTGGGHLAPAKSLASYIDKHFPDRAEVLLADGFEKTARLAREIVEGGYRRLQMQARWSYRILYAANKIPAIARFNNAIIAALTKPFLTEILLRERPEKIVIFHFFLIKPVYDILRERGLKIPVITVVTDPFTAHPMWFMRKEQDVVVFSERLKAHCVAHGMEASRVHVFPFILNEKYSQPISGDMISALKRSLGFSPERKLILILGGGDGIPKGVSILKHLLRSHIDAEIAIVCGNNTRLFEQATEIKRAYDAKTLTILGYVDTVYEMMNVSDLIISKCGASTFMEILMSMKIPIVNRYLWEQEKGNIEFVIEHRVGIYEPNIRKLPAVVKGILEDDALYRSYQENISRLSLENGTENVAHFIMNFS